MANGIKRFKVKSIGRLSGVIHEFITTVDEQDAPLLRSSYWVVQNAKDAKTGIENAYILRNGTNGAEFLHSIIAGAKPGEKVMHINGDSLDNRRANLLKRSERIEEIE